VADRPGTAPRAAAARRRAAAPEGLPLGPGSLTWKIFGDTRGLLLVGRTGVLQVMHPTISQALLDHSDYFDNPFNRILRSAPPILGVIYDEDAGATAAWVRDRHRSIKGEHADGRGRYRALDPDAYWWAHSTFFESQIARCELLGTPLTEDEKVQLYGETITWYSRYGLSMKVVPPTWDAFQAYWERMFAEVLEATPVALGALDREIPPPPFPQYEGLPWLVLGPIVGYIGPTVIRGTLPLQAQRILGIETNVAEDAALLAFRQSVKRAWPLVPKPLRRSPLVRAADARVGYRG
ncbi:MAG: oxygenase MpaB family protein, partial [Solirubrobacteraceae bacterium]|nr:oxygenase MpaB family protein [Patulibacter sp.]